MRFRKLRIAFSVTCLIACVLLIVLWVRSFHEIDWVAGPLPGSSGFCVMSRIGGLGFVLLLQPDQADRVWVMKTEPIFELKLPYRTALGFVEYLATPTAYRVRVPYWFPFLLSAAAAGVPWLRWRFSLRTMLIATTLVAAALGLIMWLR